MRRRRLLSFCPALAAALVVAEAPAARAIDERGARRAVILAIDRHRKDTWRWQRLMRRSLARTEYKERQTRSHEHRLRLLQRWKKRAARARSQARRPPHRRAWLCIQRYEGRWKDPNPPYWGGLQMDMAFQRTYGRDLLRRKGTANNWTPLEQMWVAERALQRGRGFYPWPTAARRCGLI